MFDTMIKNGQMVLPDRVMYGDIAIKNGKIAAIGKLEAEAEHVVEAQGCYVLPGLVDVHMHISEPGRTEWEGYFTGTQAMAAGGTTSFVEMPLNTMPATIDEDSLNLKLAAAKDQCFVDYSPMGGLVPHNLDKLEALSKAGVAAFKCFVATCGSGKAGDFKNVDDYELYVGMQQLAKTDDLLVIHCENAALTDKLGKQAQAEGKKTLADYVATRPVFTEVEAVRRVLLLAKETGCRVHIAHCSCPEAVEEVIKAQAEGVDASLESCPHYFLLTTEALDDIGMTAKCSPPIRDKANQNRMWALLEKGIVPILGSDHSPCTPDLKATDDAFKAWGGIAGCQNSLDLMFDAAVKKRNMNPVTLMRALSTEPARRFRLSDKGELSVGKDADIVILDPNQDYTLRAQDLYYKNKISAYVGFHIGCRVKSTWLRGREIYRLGDGILGKPSGKRIPLHR